MYSVLFHYSNQNLHFYGAADNIKTIANIL